MITRRTSCRILLTGVLLSACREEGADIRVVRQRLAQGNNATATSGAPSSDSPGADESKANDVDVLERRASPSAIYFVTLAGMPAGRKLSLSCEWRDPRGALAHENEWETREIDHSPWTTHCRNAFPSDARPGRWKVTMWMGERMLSRKEFEVR